MFELCGDTLCIRANCLPEIKKDRVYKLVMQLDGQSIEIEGAQCGCPAGRGPKASCKHIAALCYALEDFSRLQQSPDFLTCTDRLQTWNQPRPKKLEPIAVEDLRTRKQQLKPSAIRSSRQTRTASQFDPRPEEFAISDLVAIENLRCRLLQLNKPCAFTQLLIPSVDKIDHDHSYCNRLAADGTNTDTRLADDQLMAKRSTEVMDVRVLAERVTMEVKGSLCVDSKTRMEVEEKTRRQSATKEWHHARVRRITASVCGLHKSASPLLFSLALCTPSVLTRLHLLLHGDYRTSRWRVAATNSI